MTFSMTKTELFSALVSVVGNSALADGKKAEMVKMLNHEIELLEKKSANRKPTNKQKENEILKSEILSVLAFFDRPTSITEIMKNLSNKEITNQRVSALLTQLKSDNLVVRTEEKRKAFFSLSV